MLPAILSVSQLNRVARDVLQRNFSLLWVSGEISNLTRAASGHVYFSLKDESAQVRCAMFRNRAQTLDWRVENGQQVEAQGLVTLYEARGDFQLNIEGLRRAGIGALYAAYARIRDQLEREGLFATDRKKALPRYPARIGIVTSPQAAALRDILTALHRRAAHVSLLLYPVPVQGEGAAERIAAAIHLAGERSECDVLIVARGGGSIEDLWAFNNEDLARAIAASHLPIISGIGHETDTTIADFVADSRAPTPTAAAELVSAGWFAAAHDLVVLDRGLQRAIRLQIEARMQRVDLITHRLVHPGARLRSARQTLALLNTRLFAALARRVRRDVAELKRSQAQFSRQRPALAPAIAAIALLGHRLSAAFKSRLAAQQNRLATTAATLVQLSPSTTLQRGYTIVRDSDGRVVTSSRHISAGDTVELQFAFGWASGRIEQTG